MKQMNPTPSGLKQQPFNCLRVCSLVRARLGSSSAVLALTRLGLHLDDKFAGAGCSWEPGITGLLFFLQVASGPLTLQVASPCGLSIQSLQQGPWRLGSQKQELPGLLKAQAQLARCHFCSFLLVKAGYGYSPVQGEGTIQSVNARGLASL